MRSSSNDRALPASPTSDRDPLWHMSVEDFYASSAELLRLYARTLLADPDRADDVVQEVFASLLSRASQERGLTLDELREAVRQACASELRRGRRFLRVESDDLLTIDGDAREDAIGDVIDRWRDALVAAHGSVMDLRTQSAGQTPVDSVDAGRADVILAGYEALRRGNRR